MKTLEKNSEPILSGLSMERPEVVCFVCTGNTCRSPMAAAVLNDLTRPPNICTACDIEKLLSGKRVRAVSAGLCGWGEPIADNAARALEQAGILSHGDNDYLSHVSRTIDKSIMETCDRVIGLTSDHAMRLLTMFPEYASKISCFPESIPDPFGGDLEEYRRCLDAIRAGIDQMFFHEDDR